MSCTSALDGLPGELPAMASGDYRAAVVEAERAIRRLDAVKLRLVAAADAVDVSREAGLPDTTAWLAKNTHATGARQLRGRSHSPRTSRCCRRPGPRWTPGPCRSSTPE
ncbi:MAG: hypothetical protein V9F00_04615 [Nocardioides sp.]